MLLHGEQYVEIFSPLPTDGKFIVKPSLIDIQDKGKAALVITRASIVDPDTDKVYAMNEVTAFVRKSGGFGRTQPVARTAAATAANKPPQRSPDAVIEEQTSPDLAALYRLNADYNPLHIDPAFSSKGGFPNPILHGLCTFGISTKHVLQQYGGNNPGCIKSIKVPAFSLVMCHNMRSWHGAALAGSVAMMLLLCRIALHCLCFTSFYLPPSCMCRHNLQCMYFPGRH